MHGKTSLVEHDGRGCSPACRPCEVGRYHSLIARAARSLPPELEVTARTAEGEIMGVRHRELRVEGVQFHPESVLTPEGPKLMANFLRLTSRRREGDAHEGRCSSVNARTVLKSLDRGRGGDLLRGA
jgi:anthranilate/para-aminobenzoate synthase component II